ncbi:hypothetical protein, partial [Corallococcus sp. AB045]|uniref:hypothetical protein n=1 Tax=Corallococcus sp. AB045 TaxID=2316719 RepID=UPI001F35D1AE
MGTECNAERLGVLNGWRKDAEAPFVHASPCPQRIIQEGGRHGRAEKVLMDGWSLGGSLLLG